MTRNKWFPLYLPTYFWLGFSQTKMAGAAAVKKQVKIKPKKEAKQKKDGKGTKTGGKVRRKPTGAEKQATKQDDKVEKIRLLETKLGMTKLDALLAYDKFHKTYENGTIMKADFLQENKVKKLKMHTSYIYMMLLRTTSWLKQSSECLMRITVELFPSMNTC